MSEQTSTEQAIRDRWATRAADNYTRNLAAVAARFREIANRIESDGVARPVQVANGDGLPDYLWAVQQVIHAIVWGTANANVDGLLAAAEEAHNAIRSRDK